MAGNPYYGGFDIAGAMSKIRNDPTSSYDGRGYSEGSGENEMFYANTPAYRTGNNYFHNGMALREFGDGGYYVYKPSESGKNSQLSYQPYDQYDANGNYLGTDHFGAMTDGDSSGMQMFKALATIAGGVAGGTALAGAAGAGAAAGGAAGGLGTAGLETASAGFGPAFEAAVANGTWALPEYAAGYGSLGGLGSGAMGAGGAGGVMDLGGGITMGADGAIGGATPFSTSTLSNAGLMDAVGAGGAASPSMISQLANKLGVSESTAQSMAKTLGSSGLNSLLGMGATAVGGLLGAQGQEQSLTSARQMDPRVAQSVYGQLLPKTDALLGAQGPLAEQYGAQMGSVGQGLLNTKVTPDFNSNPYMQATANDLQRRTSEMLAQNNLSTQGNAVMGGSLGGSRQGVAQGIAAGRAADSLQGQLANMYMGQYNTDANRNLQQITLGAGLMGQGLDTAWAPIKNSANVMSPFTGFGTTTQSGTSGGGAQGLLGGAMGATQFAKNMGWFGGSSPSVQSTNNWGVGNSNNMFDGVDVSGYWS